jgi:hypothetical protein
MCATVPGTAALPNAAFTGRQLIVACDVCDTGEIMHASGAHSSFVTKPSMANLIAYTRHQAVWFEDSLASPSATARRFQEELQEMPRSQARFSAFVELRQSLPSHIEATSSFLIN